MTDLGLLGPACSMPDCVQMSSSQIKEHREYIGNLCKEARKAIKKIVSIRKTLAQEKIRKAKQEVLDRKQAKRDAKELAKQQALEQQRLRKQTKTNLRLQKEQERNSNSQSRRNVSVEPAPVVVVDTHAENCRSLGLNSEAIANPSSSASQVGKWTLTTSGTANENIILTRRFRPEQEFEEVLDTASPLTQDVFEFQYRLLRNADGTLSFNGFVYDNLSWSCRHATCTLNERGVWYMYDGDVLRYISAINEKTIAAIFRDFRGEIQDLTRSKFDYVWGELHQLAKIAIDPIPLIPVGKEWELMAPYILF